jgi:NAD(P)-dependent dehydrogenase (short-subunit alcohol dehydrogenase family)
MNFIILGSAGGLGSFLLRYLRKNFYNSFGMDLVSSPEVDFKLDQNNSQSLRGALINCFSSCDGPWTVVISIAAPQRAKGISDCATIKHNIADFMPVNSLILLDVIDCIQHFAQNASEESHVINIGSVLSDRFSTAETPAYGASKAAVKSLIRDLSILHSSNNLCINSISPALLYRNDKSHEFIMERLSHYSLPLEATDYSDIAKLIVFLACSGIKSLRGKDIVLDYGLESVDGFDLLSSSYDL